MAYILYQLLSHRITDVQFFLVFILSIFQLLHLINSSSICDSLPLYSIPFFFILLLCLIHILFINSPSFHYPLLFHLVIFNFSLFNNLSSSTCQFLSNLGEKQTDRQRQTHTRRRLRNLDVNEVNGKRYIYYRIFIFDEWEQQSPTKQICKVK